MRNPWKWLAIICMATIALQLIVSFDRHTEEKEVEELRELVRKPPVEDIVSNETTALRLAVVLLEVEFSVESVVD